MTAAPSLASPLPAPCHRRAPRAPYAHMVGRSAIDLRYDRSMANGVNPAGGRGRADGAPTARRSDR